MQGEAGDSLGGIAVTLWVKGFTPGVSTYTVRTSFTDQNGAFRFANLPPGDYMAAGWEEMDVQLVQVPAFLAQFSSEVSAVTVTEGGSGSVQVKVVPAEKIRAAEAKIP